VAVNCSEVQDAPPEHKEASGKAWDTVKPLARYFSKLHRVLLVDDDAFKVFPLFPPPLSFWSFPPSCLLLFPYFHAFLVVLLDTRAKFIIVSLPFRSSSQQGDPWKGWPILCPCHSWKPHPLTLPDSSFCPT